MRSMTGFGVGELATPAGRLVVEARSVNHRFLDVRVKLPREMSDHHVFCEQVAREKLTRGRVDIAVHCEGCGHAPVTVDRARAAAVLRDFQAVAEELGIPGPVPLSVLVTVPDLFVQVHDRDPSATRERLAEGIALALADLDRMRAREGEALAADLRARLEHVGSLLRAVEGRAEAMVTRQRQRFRARLERLMEGFEVDAVRLEQELAIMADHADVSEELTRLECHRAQLERLLSVAEPSGRRMDFLLQEMAREVNTLGSKATDGDVTLAVVELKAELERMREQVQNIE